MATDNAISKSTAYDYLHEGINALAARAPKLESVLLAAKMAGHPHANIDGTLIETDRCATPGPTPGVDLWWSGKHANHGGNIQVLTAPDGWPLWTSQVRPGREHDTTALREHTEILPLFTTWTTDHLRVLGDLGYEGEADTITIAFKKPKNGELSNTQMTYNKVHNGIRAVGERGNSLLKMTFKALRNVSLCPWTVGRIVAAALVLLHVDHLGPLPDDITVHLDAGYDSDKTRIELAARNLHGRIAHKGEKALVQASQRWHVVRTHAWQNAFHRLARCYERRATVVNAFFDLANTIITVRSLIRRAWTTHRWDTRPRRRP